MSRYLVGLILLVPGFASGLGVNLRFNPKAGVQYTFHVTGEETDGFQLRREYDAVLQFDKKGAHRYAMRGRIVHAKVADSQEPEDNEMADQLNRTRLRASYDLSARLLGVFTEEATPPASIVDKSSLSEELSGYSLMNLNYPKGPVKAGAKWVTVVRGEQIYPSGEQIETMPGQTVAITYKVESITRSGARTLVRIAGFVNATLTLNAWPIDTRYSIKIRETHNFTLDAADGMLVEGTFDRASTGRLDWERNRSSVTIKRVRSLRPRVVVTLAARRLQPGVHRDAEELGGRWDEGRLLLDWGRPSVLFRELPCMRNRRRLLARIGVDGTVPALAAGRGSKQAHLFR